MPLNRKLCQGEQHEDGGGVSASQIASSAPGRAAGSNNPRSWRERPSWGGTRAAAGRYRCANVLVARGANRQLHLARNGPGVLAVVVDSLHWTVPQPTPGGTDVYHAAACRPAIGGKPGRSSNARSQWCAAESDSHGRRTHGSCPAAKQVARVSTDCLLPLSDYKLHPDLRRPREGPLSCTGPGCISFEVPGPSTSQTDSGESLAVVPARLHVRPAAAAG